MVRIADSWELWRILHRSLGIDGFDWIPPSGHEGRIGMAAVTLREGQDFDCSDTYSYVVKYLPAYAHPRFIRVQVKIMSDLLKITISFTFF